MIEYDIHGGKGGESKPHQPVETPNNLLSTAVAKVLIAVAEGELAGNPTAKDIYLDGTPLQNADGSLNFGGVKWEWRSGSQVQNHIVGLPEVSTEFSVGQELTTLNSWTRLITNTNLDGVRFTVSANALLRQEDNGDTTGVVVEFVSEISTDGGPFTEYQRYVIDGKTNAGYEKTYRIDLPEANNNWSIRVRRLTPDTESGKIQDKIGIKSYAEVLDVKQTYPNTALLYVEFDSQLFGGGNIPRVSVRTRGRVVRVPSNYDAETRTYTGIWNGDFKFSWTNNPIWVYYDIVTNDRFGLGKRVTPAMVDKYAMYEVAQYCDVMVSKGDGSGEMEPRHTCNIYIQEQKDAWTVLRDIASIFNGMTYWNGNQFVAFADKQEDISDIPLFSRANVANGRFDYQSADEKSLYTSALVSYDDPEDHYKTQVEATSEQSEILRLGGDRVTEISAIGCTSRGEAQRRGKYVLLTNLFDRQVNFRTGLQGMDERVHPGKVIHVLDPLLGGRPFTGRVKVAAQTVITLDRDVQAKAGDILYITKKNGATEGRTVQSAQGNVVQVTVAFSEQPQTNTVWYLEAADLKSQLFRVTKVTSPSEGVFDIDAVEYNDSKYAAIDNGARLERRPISVVPAGMQQAPQNIVISSRDYVEQTLAVSVLVVNWDQTPNAINYEVQWRTNEGDWVNAGFTGANHLEIKGIYTGSYVVRIRAINAGGIKSVWAYSQSTLVEGKAGTPPAITSLTASPMVFGIRLDWTFPEGSTDTLRTEFVYSQSPDFANGVKLGDFSYPTDSHELHGLRAGQQFWFWARIVDRTGNIGPWYPSETGAGVVGQSSTDQSQYEEYFKEQITSSALDKTLTDRIDLIDGPPSLPGSVNNRLQEVQQEIAESNQAIADLTTQLNTDIAGVKQDIENVNKNLQEQIDRIDLTETLPYNPNNTYTSGQAVLGEDGKLYQAKQDVPVQTPPPNATYWTDIGQAVITADGLAARVTKVETDVTNIDGRVTANANLIDSVQSQLNDKADATALNSLTTRVSDAEGKIESQGTAITSLSSTVGNIGGNGSNILPSEYCAFTEVAPSVIVSSGALTTSVESDTATFSGYALKLVKASGTGTVFLAKGTTLALTNMSAKKARYIVSLYSRVGTDGQQFRFGLRSIRSDGGTTFHYSQAMTGSTAWTRHSFVVDLTAVEAEKLTMVVDPRAGTGSYNVPVYVDKLMVEEQIGTNTAPSVFVPGPSYDQLTGLATATSSLTTRVTAAEGKIDTQAQQIVNLNTKVDGKADSQAVQSLTNRVATAEGKIDTNSSAITNLNTRVDGKAEQTAVTALSNRVTVAEGKIDAQGTSITQLGTTVNGIAGAGTNLVPDTYSWIDTSARPPISDGGQSVSTNVAIPDSQTGYGIRVTTSANPTTNSSVYALLGSPNNATGRNIQVTPGKYLASMYVRASVATTGYVSLYDGTHRVSADVTLPTTRTRITFPVTVSDTSVVNLTLYPNRGLIANAWVEYDSIMLERQIGPNETASPFTAGPSAARLTGQATAVQALTTRVTTAEGNITSQAQALTQLKSSIGGTGSNLLPATYSNYNSVRPNWVYANSLSEVVADPEAFTGYAFKVTTNSTNVSAAIYACDPAENYASFNMGFQQGKYIVSYYAKSDTAGHLISFYLRGRNNAGAAASSLIVNQEVALTTAWKRYSHVIDMSASSWATYDKMALGLQINRSGVSGRTIYLDRIMVEKQVADGVEPSTFVQGPIGTQTYATAEALQTLNTRVTTVEGSVTSLGTSVTNLKASVDAIPSENLVLDPSFISSNSFNSSVPVVLSRSDASVPAGAPSTRVVRITQATATGNTYYAVNSAVNVRPPESSTPTRIAVSAGETYDYEAYIYSTVSRQQGIWVQVFNIAGTQIGSNWVTASGDGERYTTKSGQWVKITGSFTMPADCTNMAMTYRISNGDATDVFLSSPVIRKRSGIINANATATQALEARVTTAEGTITSQSSAITSLTNDVAGKASQTALDSLSGTVTQQGNTLTAQGQAVNQLQSTVNSLGTGVNLNPSEYSVFSATPPNIGAISTGLTYTTVADSEALGTFALKLTSSSTSTTLACYLHASNSVSVAGGWPISYENGKYIISFYAKTNVAGRQIRTYLRGLNSSAGTWNSANTVHTLTTTWVRYSQVVDLTNTATYSGNRMVFAFQPNISGVSGTEIYFDRIMVEKAIGTNTTPSNFDAGTSYTSIAGQATAISQIDTKVTQIGDSVTAVTTRVDGIYAQVNPSMVGDSSILIGRTTALVGVWTEQSARVEGDVATGSQVTNVQAQISGVGNNVDNLGNTVNTIGTNVTQVSASVQQVTEATASLDGRVKASWAVKMEVNSAGQYVAAGIGLGIENGPAGLQSQFLVRADRFAVVQGNGVSTSVPFIVENGQVFINDVLIKKATITNAIIGSTLRSQSVTTWSGEPLLEMNMVDGVIVQRNYNRANSYTVSNNTGSSVVVDGVLRVRWGVW